MIKAGFFETDITASIGMERPATYYKLYHTTIHDPLKVRACVIDDGQERVAIVGLDTCILGSKTVQKARRAVKDTCGIPEANILLAASHTHAGGSLWGFCEEDLIGAPDLIKRLALVESISMDTDYERHVIGQVKTAVVMADRCKQPARLGIGRGFEDQVAFNRRFRMKNGRTVTHPGKGHPDIVAPAGPMDPEVGVIAAWDRNDKLIGCVVNYACHGTCYGDGVSADWIYYLEQTVRAVNGCQSNVVFLNGACGDITQVDNQSLRQIESGEKGSKFVGSRVGAEVLKVLVSSEKSEKFKLAVLSESLRLKIRKPSRKSIEAARMLCERMLSEPKKTTEFHFAKERLILDYLVSKSDTQMLEIQVIQIGPAVILANPAEYFCQYGLDIKKRSNFPYTFVVELANGCAGYVPTEDAFDPEHGGGYETVLTSCSNLESGAGRAIMDASLRLAKALVPGNEPVGEQVQPAVGVWVYGALGPELD